MGETLSFAQIKLTPQQSFLCALAISDVLNSSEHFISHSGRIFFDSTEAVNGANVSVRTNDTMLSCRGQTASGGFFGVLKNALAIVGVDHFADHRHVNWTRLRRQSIDAIELVGPGYATCGEVPFVVSDVNQALRLFEPGLAFLQVAR